LKLVAGIFTLTIFSYCWVIQL